jgi:hypothetical protein
MCVETLVSRCCCLHTRRSPDLRKPALLYISGHKNLRVKEKCTCTQILPACLSWRCLSSGRPFTRSATVFAERLPLFGAKYFCWLHYTLIRISLGNGSDFFTIICVITKLAWIVASFYLIARANIFLCHSTSDLIFGNSLSLSFASRRWSLSVCKIL